MEAGDGPDSLDGNTISSTLSMSDMAIASSDLGLPAAGAGGASSSSSSGGLPRVGSASRIVAVRAAPVHPGQGDAEGSMV